MKNWKKLRDNKQLWHAYQVRAKVIMAMREYFQSEGFLEVETPLMVSKPGTEPYLEVFETKLQTPNYPDHRGFLLTSPEFSMKKLLAAGSGSIFQICKSFRNQEGLSSYHNPEFTILEFYRVDADYKDIMRDCENLLLKINEFLGNQNNQLSFQGKNYTLTVPWERISVADAFEKYAQMSDQELLSRDAVAKKCLELNLSTQTDLTWEQAYNLIFLNLIEPNLGQHGPTIVYDYPASQAALSRKKADDPRFAERFEFYLGGLELGNAFSELIDAKEQEARLKADLAERRQLGKTEYDLDGDFIDALASGMPQTGGIAIGVDRLVMLFADVSSIKDTLFFPVEDLFEFE